MKELKRKLLSVKNGPTRTTGGNQQLADSRQLRTCGCGIVSSTDMLLYLGRRGEGGGFVLAAIRYGYVRAAGLSFFKAGKLCL